MYKRQEEEQQSGSVAAAALASAAAERSSDAAAAAAAAMAAMAAEPVISKATDVVPVEGDRGDGKPWLASAWLESLDPRTQASWSSCEYFRLCHVPIPFCFTLFTKRTSAVRSTG